MKIVFAIILIILSASRGKINISPCPNYFQYGFSSQGKLIGSMGILVPKTKVYGFNVTQIYILLASEITGIPRLRLEKKVQPKVIVEDILRGTKVNLITDYEKNV